jgi:C-terminal processing protease CtpA/Prc
MQIMMLQQILLVAMETITSKNIYIEKCSFINNFLIALRLSNDSPIKYQNTNGYYDEPHYSSVPAPRYWNTLKLNKSDFTQHQQDDVMGNSISATDLVSYNNVDFSTTQQKMMSPSRNASNGTQTELNSQPVNSFQTSQQMSNSLNLMTSSFMAKNQTSVFNVQLHHNGDGILGLTLSGNEDGHKPIIISGLQNGGIAYNTGKIQIGDQLLAINEESVIGLALSEATKLLQVHNEVIELKLSRNVNNNNIMTSSTITLGEKVPQPQALYAEVQRLNPIKADAISNSSSRSGSNSSDGQLKTIHVTLYKDQVYDDYGFSVSDGLYERGVYINRIRSSGPADQVQVLKPYDRITQVEKICAVLQKKNSLCKVLNF